MKLRYFSQCDSKEEKKHNICFRKRLDRCQLSHSDVININTTILIFHQNEHGTFDFHKAPIRLSPKSQICKHKFRHHCQNNLTLSHFSFYVTIWFNFHVNIIFASLHCVKSVQIRSLFWSKYFEVSLRIQSECGKIRTRKNSVFRHISHSGSFFFFFYSLFKVDITNIVVILLIYNILIQID